MKVLKHAISKICLLLIICVVFSGCISENNSVFIEKSQNTNPESGIVKWMDAMNSHNADSLYEMSPGIIKKEINKVDFLKVNEQNAMFIDNISFVDYRIINKTQYNNHATTTAELVMARPDPISGNVTYSPIFYTFNEFFEDNEWKVWATGLDPL